MNPISPRCLLSWVFLGTGHWGHSFTASYFHALYACYALRPLGAAARPLPARTSPRSFFVQHTQRIACTARSSSTHAALVRRLPSRSRS